MTQANRPDVGLMLVSLASACALFFALMALVSFLMSWQATWLLFTFATGFGAIAAFGKLASSRQK